uniref:Uncharacterized protein n=1 Tax=Arion vulgaris TaxID=1028688 RepID=A0A0B6Z5X0_9EUPU
MKQANYMNIFPSPPKLKTQQRLVKNNYIKCNTQCKQEGNEFRHIKIKPRREMKKGKQNVQKYSCNEEQLRLKKSSNNEIIIRPVESLLFYKTLWWTNIMT